MIDPAMLNSDKARLISVALCPGDTMFRTLLCAVATIFTCGAGMASAVTFDFSGGGTNGKTLTFNEGGLTLFAETNGERIIHANNGLGVRGPSNGPEFDNALITLGEILTFRLEPRPIKSLISVVFEGGLDAERIDFVVGGITLEQLTLPRAPQQSNITFDLSSLLPSGTTEFSFVGVEEKAQGRGVLISSLEIAAVPVPAAILSLGTGLALLGGFGRLRPGSTRKRLLGKAAA